MNSDRVSEYNLDQWTSFKAIEKACRGLPESELEKLKESLDSYLQFRNALDEYQRRHFAAFCQATCFENKFSACCGFESIFTFFADQIISFLLSTPEELEALLRKLEQVNRTERCVYLGESGCMWRISPISCAMFLCEQAKRTVFGEDRGVEAMWEQLRMQEKEYTLPTKPVLFDDLERYFINLGVDSPHMYFHKSAGLLRLKARFGLKTQAVRQSLITSI
jgi:hypothetical protein